MKKNKKWGITGLLLLLLIIFKVNAKAAIVDNSTVSKDKVWKITFNQKIKFNQNAINSIKVFNKSGEKINIRLDFSKDEKSIIVKAPLRGYVEGETYTLNVENNIYSKLSASRLSNGRNIKFDIKVNDPFKNMKVINAEDTVKAKAGQTYVFNKMDKLISNEDKKEAIKSGWDFKIYNYSNFSSINVALNNRINAKELRVPIKLNGFYGVYIGYLSDTEEFIVEHNEKVEKIKTTKDDENGKYINESFAFAEDFNDDSICIKPVKDKNCSIAYIKLVALDSKQREIYNNNGFSKDPKTIYDNDGYTDFFWGKYPNVESLEKLPTELMTKLDAGEINWTLGTTGLLNYNSKYAGDAFADFDKYEYEVREGDKRAKEQILNILDSGRSPLEIIADKSQKIGLKTNVCLRMDAFYGQGYTKFLNGAIYNEYEDCLQDNSVYLSYYYPKFRSYILNILKEASMPKNVQGITLDFCRYPNVMGREASQEEKTDIMNYFMKKVRTEIPNKKITVRIPHVDPEGYGLDIKTWVKEGYVDRIVPSVISYEEFFNIDKYEKMVKGTNVEFYVGIAANLKGGDATPDTENSAYHGKLPGNKYLSVEEYLYRANEVYNKGGNGVFIFNILNDMDLYQDYVSPKFKFLGDKNKVKRWYEFEYPAYCVNYKVEY